MISVLLLIVTPLIFWISLVSLPMSRKTSHQRIYSATELVMCHQAVIDFRRDEVGVLWDFVPMPRTITSAISSEATPSGRPPAPTPSAPA